MVALAVVALLWGNCFSCPDMIALAASHPSPHSCCHKPQPSTNCHTQNLQQFVQADAHAPVAQTVAELTELPAVPAPVTAWALETRTTLHSPPEPPNLPATLRI